MSVTERPRLMTRWLVRDLDTAMMFYEAARPLWLDRRIGDRFHLTEAGNTAASLRFASELQAAMTVLRMWDRDKDTASLVALKRELSFAAVHEALVADATTRVERLYCKAVRDEIDAELVRWSGAIGLAETRYSRNLARLRAYRNKRLAHRNPFDLDGLSLAGTAERGDITVMLGVARRIIRGLRPYIDGTIDRPRDTQRIRRRYAEAFWAIPLRSERRPDD